MTDSQKMAVQAVTLIFGAALFFFGIGMVADPYNYGWMISTQTANLLGPMVMFVGFLMTFGSLGAFLLGFRPEGDEGEGDPGAIYSAPPASILDRPPKPFLGADPFLTPEPKPKPPKRLDVPIVTSERLACPHLIGLTGGLPSKIQIPVGRFTIGRDSENDLALTSQLVSRHHAQLEWDGETLVVRDLGSGNATRVNDEVIAEDHTLQDGDVIQIVDYNLEVELPPSLSRTVILPRGSKSHSSE